MSDEIARFHGVHPARWRGAKIAEVISPGKWAVFPLKKWQNAIMVKTQVQIPDHLFREAKRLAEENGMSFAEVVRRGLEEIVRHHSPGRTRIGVWTPPEPFDLGAALVPEEEWSVLCHESCGLRL